MSAQQLDDEGRYLLKTSPDINNDIPVRAGSFTILYDGNNGGPLPTQDLT
jgi:hypothetical protein